MQISVNADISVSPVICLLSGSPNPKREPISSSFIFLSLSEIRGFIQKSFNSFRTPSSSVPSSSVCLLTTRRSKIHSRDRPERIRKSPVSSIRCQLELFKYHNRFAVISCKYHISLQQRYKFFYLRIIWYYTGSRLSGSHLEYSRLECHKQQILMKSQLIAAVAAFLVLVPAGAQKKAASQKVVRANYELAERFSAKRVSNMVYSTRINPRCASPTPANP